MTAASDANPANKEVSLAPAPKTAEASGGASNDIILQSIRVHKFLTSTGEIGKVATAKFLSSIDLNENTKLIDLNNEQIDAIVKYIEG